jgi:hypothetical protein
MGCLKQLEIVFLNCGQTYERLDLNAILCVSEMGESQAVQIRLSSI